MISFITLLVLFDCEQQQNRNRIGTCILYLSSKTERKTSNFSLTLEVWASSTNFTICDSVVSWPTWVASINNDPFWLMVPPITESPGFLMTGMDSPVIRDSSAVDVPWSTLQSTGILAPGTTLRKKKMYNTLLHLEFQRVARNSVQWNSNPLCSSTNLPSHLLLRKEAFYGFGGY